MVGSNVSSSAFFKKNALATVLLDRVAQRHRFIHQISNHTLSELLSCFFNLRVREFVVFPKTYLLNWVCKLLFVFAVVQLLPVDVQVIQSRPSDFCLSPVLKFDAWLAVLLYYVCANQRSAVQTRAQDAVVSWSLDVVFLNYWTSLDVVFAIWCALYSDSLIMTFLKCIFENIRIVIDQLYR